MRQLTRDEGSYMPNGKMLCLLKYKAIETVSPLRAITIFDWPLGRSESASPSFYLRAPGLRMELFSRRRWRLVSVQLSNKVGYCPSCTVSIVLVFNKHYSLPLGQIRAFLSLLLLKSSLAISLCLGQDTAAAAAATCITHCKWNYWCVKLVPGLYSSHLRSFDPLLASSSSGKLLLLLLLLILLLLNSLLKQWGRMSRRQPIKSVARCLPSEGLNSRKTIVIFFLLSAAIADSGQQRERERESKKERKERKNQSRLNE